MASLILGAVGSYFGGPIGGFIGSRIGGFIDATIFAPDPQQFEGPRLVDLSVQHATPGQPIGRPFGTIRMAGGVVWSSGLVETRHEETQGGGGKGAGGGGGGSSTVVTYTYSVSVAVLVCRGPISSIGRIWGDSKLIRDANGKASRVDGGIRVYTGTQTQTPDSLIEAAEGNVPAHRGHVVVIFDTLQLADFGNRVPNFTFEIVERTGIVTPVTIITAMLEDSGLVDGVDFDASCVQKNPITGYAVQRIQTARGVIEQLQAIFPFDAANTGFKLVFRARNRFIDSEIDKNDLGATADDNRPDRRQITRRQDLELPKEINLAYLDPNRDYQVNEARSRRIRLDAENVQMIEIPIVLEPSEAKFAVDSLAGRNHIERFAEDWALPWKYAYLDAGDIVAIKRTDFTFERFRILKTVTGVNGLIKLSVVPDEFQWAPVVAPASVISIVPHAVPITADTFLYLSNLPLLLDTDSDQPGFYVTVSTDDLSQWGGANVFESSDGVNFTAIETLIFAAAAGTADTALADGPTEYIDRRNGVVVTLINGSLTSIQYDQMFGRANVAVLGNEIIKFQTATLIGTNQYLLQNLKRGVRGTEHHTGSHATGERFFVLAPASTDQHIHTSSLIGASRLYKAVTFRQTLADVGSPTNEITFTPTAENLRPWSGVCPVVVRDGDDITLTWVRRNRRENGWLNNRGVPVSEDSEFYEVDVMSDATDAATVLRTITATTPSVAYTAAQQAADFGSVQDPVTFRIYQMSAVVGRGNVLTATL